MRRFITILLLFTTLAAAADERGEKRLETISRHYAKMGRYSVEFLLRAGEGVQRGVMLVDGNNSYLKAGDMEIFIVDNLRYEVRVDSKEIIVDRADAYEKELLNSLNGFSAIAADYAIEECEFEGKTAVRLTPKKQGDVAYVVTTPSGESVAKLLYGAGENKVEIIVEKSQPTTQKLPVFSKEEYKGFELIDFR